MPIPVIRVYDIYNALSLHFKGTGFNACKYNFHTRVSEASLQKHRAKSFFHRLAPTFNNEESAVYYIASNFIAGEKWIGSFNKKNENKLIAYKESLQYKFEEDLKINFENGFESIKKYVENMVNSQDFNNLTFFILFDYATNGETMKKLKKEFDNNILFDEFEEKCLTNSSIMVHLFKVDEQIRKNLLMTIIKQNISQGKKEIKQ